MKLAQPNHDNDNSFGIIVLIASIIAACVLAMVVSSCSPEKRIMRIATKHPAAIVTPCNVFLPPLVTHDSTIIKYIAGKPITTTDTVTLWDTITNTYYSTITKTKHVTDTVVNDRLTVEVDQVSQGLAKKLKIENVKLTAQKALWRRWCLIFGALVLFGMVGGCIGLWLKIKKL